MEKQNDKEFSVVEETIDVAGEMDRVDVDSNGQDDGMDSEYVKYIDYSRSSASSNKKQKHLKSDEEIIDMYWQRNEAAVVETDKKYGKYLFTIANNIRHWLKHWWYGFYFSC